MILCVVEKITDPYTKEKDTWVKFFKNTETAKKYWNESIEEFREQALEIIKNYEEKGFIDPEWEKFDVEEIIENHEDDLEEKIKWLSFNLYKSFDIYFPDIEINYESDVNFSQILYK